jgi:hypothetical protein
MFLGTILVQAFLGSKQRISMYLWNDLLQTSYAADPAFKVTIKFQGSLRKSCEPAQHPTALETMRFRGGQDESQVVTGLHFGFCFHIIRSYGNPGPGICGKI